MVIHTIVYICTWKMDFLALIPFFHLINTNNHLGNLTLFTEFQKSSQNHSFVIAGSTSFPLETSQKSAKSNFGDEDDISADGHRNIKSLSPHLESFTNWWVCLNRQIGAIRGDFSFFSSCLSQKNTNFDPLFHYKLNHIFSKLHFCAFHPVYKMCVCSQSTYYIREVFLETE